MPQVNIINLPTTYAFYPVRREGAVVFYRESEHEVPALRSSLSISLVEPTKTSRLYKVRMKCVVPVAEVDPNTSAQTGKVARLNSFDLSFIFDANSTTDERQIMVNTLNELAAHTIFADVVKKLEPIF